LLNKNRKTGSFTQYSHRKNTKKHTFLKALQVKNAAKVESGILMMKNWVDIGLFFEGQNMA